MQFSAAFFLGPNSWLQRWTDFAGFFSVYGTEVRVKSGM